MDTDSSSIRYPLARIGENLKVSFCVITNVNQTLAVKGKTIVTSTITKRSPNKVNNYYDVNLHPFIDLDFNDYSDKLENRLSGVSISGQCKISLNKYNLFLFLNMIKKLERDFIINKDLYFYSNNKLILNNDVAKTVSVDTVLSNKRLMMGPAVITVGGGEKEHEGIYFALNDLSNYTYLTYTELGYLRYVLDNIDMDLMAINLIKLVGENKIVTSVNNTTISIDSTDNVSTKPQEEDNSSSHNIIITSENVIPSL